MSMTKMTSRERVLCALAGGTPDMVPLAEQFVARPVCNQLVGRPLDETVPQRELADALGNDIVKFSRNPPLFYEEVAFADGTRGIGPGRIRARADLAAAVMPAGDEWIADARTFLRTQRGERAAVGGMRLGISGVLVSMGLDNFSVALYDDRALIEELLDRYLAFAERAIQVFCELGFDLIWCFDDFAYHSGPMFSPAVFRELFLPRLRRATARISVPWIFHSDGNLFPVLDDLLTLGMSGLHPIEPEAMDLAEVKRAVGRRACLIGNVSVDLLARGTPAQVEAAVEEALAAGSPGGGYMLSSGNSIPGYAKLENVRAMIASFHQRRHRYGDAAVR